MKAYGRKRGDVIERPDAADLRAMGATSRWARVATANRRAVRRRMAKTARREGRSLCAAETL